LGSPEIADVSFSEVLSQVTFGDGETAVLVSDGTSRPIEAHVKRLDPEGSIQWSRTVGKAVVPSNPMVPTHSGGLIVAGKRRLVHYDKDGSRIWSVNTDAPITSGPTVGPDSNVYVGVGSHFGAKKKSTLLAYSSDGEKRWDYMASSPSGSSVAIAVGSGGRIFYAWRAGTEDTTSYITAISGSGDARWTRKVKSPGFDPAGAIAIHPTGRWLVVFRSGYEVVRFDRDGTKRWSLRLEGEFGTPRTPDPYGPVLDKTGTIVVALSDTEIKTSLGQHNVFLAHGTIYTIDSSGRITGKHEVKHEFSYPEKRPSDWQHGITASFSGPLAAGLDSDLYFALVPRVIGASPPPGEEQEFKNGPQTGVLIRFAP